MEGGAVWNSSGEGERQATATCPLHSDCRVKRWKIPNGTPEGGWWHSCPKGGKNAELVAAFEALEHCTGESLCAAAEGGGDSRGRSVKPSHPSVTNGANTTAQPAASSGSIAPRKPPAAPQHSGEGRQTQQPREKSGPVPFTHASTNPPIPSPDIFNGNDLTSWKLVLFDELKTSFSAQNAVLLRGGNRDALVESAVGELRTAIETKGHLFVPPADLSQSEVEEEVFTVAEAAVGQFLSVPATRNGTAIAKIEERELIICEEAEQALISNAEYLSRPAIVERLYYSQHISLGVGGKHEGKTTNVRTEALAIATGKPVYDRPTMQTYVIYAASDDEYATTRMELLRMGWNPSVSLTLVRVKQGEATSTPERVLEQIAKMARRLDSHFIVLDMLFDFVKITDEIKYAGTREAIGFLQILADEVKGHVRATHHSPKWMPDATSAAKAALGSQGIAARFSPIVLSKKWANDLYTVESTMTRDPRGLALPVLCVERDDSGWARVTGEFKSWMKWKLYADRILGLFGEPGVARTVSDIADALEINRPEAQNALYQMTLGDGAVLEREKFGHKYKYRLKENGLFGAGEEARSGEAR